MKRLFSALVALCLTGAALAQDHPWDQPIDPAAASGAGQGSDTIPAPYNDGKNEYPGGNPVPEAGNPPPMDADYMITPAVNYMIRGGYVGTIDNAGVNNGGGVGAMVFMDGGRTGIMLQTAIAGTQGGVFAYAEGEARVRYRIPIDPKHIVWGAIGVDIAGRGAVDPKADSYFTAQLPVALIGTMFNVNGACVVHVFAKAAFGIYDNQTQAPKWEASWDNFVKPAVGAEAMAACGTIRVIADYQHIFNFGKFGDTEKAGLQYAQTWDVGEKGWQLGFFVKGNYLYERGLKDMIPNDTLNDARHVAQVFGGLEVRWGAKPAEIPRRP